MKRLIILCLMSVAAAVQAAKIPESKAVKAILGEASNQSFKTMVAIGCVIRNRGSLRGVYGVTNPVVKKAGPKLIAKARRAWRESALRDVTHGLKFFGCHQDERYFRSIGLHPVMQSGDITFYR